MARGCIVEGTAKHGHLSVAPDQVAAEQPLHASKYRAHRARRQWARTEADGGLTLPAWWTTVAGGASGKVGISPN